MARINRAVELLAANQPIYYVGPEGRGYDGGVAAAHTWADYINYDIEHHPFDMNELRAFIAGLLAGGPTKSGHRVPAVIVTLPIDGTSEAAVRANSWVIKQVLACGVHGLLLCHAEDPGAVRAFIEAARYPFNTLRGSASGGAAAAARNTPPPSGGSPRANISIWPSRGRSTRAANCCSA